MMRTMESSLLNELKSWGHSFIVVEVFKLGKNEDPSFRDLDKVGVVCPLGPPID